MDTVPPIILRGLRCDVLIDLISTWPSALMTCIWEKQGLTCYNGHVALNIFYVINYSYYTPLFIHMSHQELQRRAPSTGRRTEPRTSSWSWRTAWRSERGTNQKSLSKSRKCLALTKQRMACKWNKSSRVCLMGPPSGQRRSASLVSIIKPDMLFIIYVCDSDVMVPGVSAIVLFFLLFFF